MNEIKFFANAEQVPSEKPFMLAAEIMMDLRPALRRLGATGYMDVDDLGECEHHFFQLENGVIYMATNHLQLPDVTVIEVNSTKKPIAILLSDMFERLEIHLPAHMVFEIHHEFDRAKKNAGPE